jgi:hypothetical protein
LFQQSLFYLWIQEPNWQDYLNSQTDINVSEPFTQSFGQFLYRKESSRRRLLELPDPSALLAKSKAIYRNKLVIDDPNMSPEAVSALIMEFAEFGLDVDYSGDLGITASDIFRSVTGVAYKSIATGAILQDILSIVDLENP